MELKELLREIHWIEWQLRKFEDRYGVRSEDFFKAMEAGELADFDDIDDPHFHDFMAVSYTHLTLPTSDLV